MRFKAYVEQGLWSSEVQKLSRVMGWSLEETLRKQAKLLVRDCILLTPPCERQLKEVKGSFSGKLKEQLKWGQKAIARDVLQVFVPQDSRRVFSIRGNKRGDKLAEQLAKIAATGDVGKLNRTLASAGYASQNNRFSQIAKAATLELMKTRRTANGKTNWKNRRILLHSGNAQAYDSNFETERAWQINPSIEALVNKLSEKIGRAKAGWAPAAKQLKLGLPKWIKSQAKGAEGMFKIEGAGTPKVAITVASSVPYMQAKGAAMRIVERAWAMRLSKIAKQRKIAEHGKNAERFKKFLEGKEIKLSSDQNSQP